MHIKLWPFLLLLIPTIHAVVQVFDAFDRKIFKEKKQRYASFDMQGILTLDGSLNGKSNDIVFPNGEESFMRQSVCNSQPGLMFELCEMEKYRPWTGVAICYESQLSQPYINPFFRIQTVEKMRPLVKVLCGERQSAIFINREVQNGGEKAGGIEYGKYEPFYSIGASFTEEKILFKMPNDTVAERPCALLHLGGKKGMLNVSVTTLRRQPLDIYDRHFQRINISERFPQRFPDLANRKYRLSRNQGLWFLLLDFSPPFGMVQNISIYGWLPLKIKITGKAIKPCTLNWEMIQSRTVSGGLVASCLKIIYELTIGVQNTLQATESSSNQTENSKSEGTEFGAGLQADVSPEQFAVKGMSKGLKKFGKGLQAASASMKANLRFSLGNTKGSQDGQGEFAGITESSFEQRQTTRRETIIFDDFDGTLNIEQLVYRCHGWEVRPDKIRYHDPDGNAIIPESIESSTMEGGEDGGGGGDEDDGDDEDQQDDYCMDNVAECPIWARRQECQKRKVFMLSRCKFSCGICKNVEMDKKYLREERERHQPEYDEPEEVPCVDGHKFCPTFARDGLCQKNPLLMSTYCRLSCALCITQFDAINRDKEAMAQSDGL